MDWSVLNEPDWVLGAEARAALTELTPDARTELSQRLGKNVLTKLKEMIHPWFSSGFEEWADVDVCAAEMRDGALVLHFIADHCNYNFAQSGSDWADHYVFVGAVHLVAGKRKRQSFELAHHVHLTEHEHENYDRRKTLDEVRARVRARLRG
jgi:rhamnose utilization protein RhaD (predicted bifunctional aldolase and dehydrogenase)